MTNDTLIRFRKGLKAKRFTLTAVKDATGIPVQRLAEMADENWGRGFFKTRERLDLLEQALEQIESTA